VLLRIDDAQSGRELFRRLTPHIDSADSWWSAANPWLSVGISYAGLKALGLPEIRCKAFPKLFAKGWRRAPDNSET
jgi:hypothetical protein